MSKPIYINNLNFHDGKTMHRRGEINANPKEVYIRRGMVREAKIDLPAEVKNVRRKKRKSDDATQRNTELDERSDSQPSNESGAS